MAVTQIREYASKETVATLRELLSQAERGEISGFAFACKLGAKNHGIGICDDYRRDPAQVLAITARIEYRLNQIIEVERNRCTAPMRIVGSCKERTMSKLPALLLALAAPCAMSQVSCQQIGAFTTCSDGTSYNRIGNQVYGSDGSSAQRIGNQTFINPAPQQNYQPPVFQVPQYNTAPIMPIQPIRPQQCGINAYGQYVCR